MRPRATSALLWVVSVLFASAYAHAAEPTAADKETARRLMSEARTQRSAGDDKSALQSFLAADSIMHVPTTGLEVARAQVQLGELVEARDTLLSVARIPVQEDEPSAFTEARDHARKLQAEIELRIPSLKVRIPGVPEGESVKIVIDGAELASAGLSVPRSVNPGHHVVKAITLAGATNAAPVEIGEGETKEIALEIVASAAARVAPQEVALAGDPGQRRTWRLVGYASLGVGAVSLLTGGITGALALASFNSAKKDGCVGNDCPPAAYPSLDTANSLATASTVGFIIGGIGVAGGVVGLVIGKGGLNSGPHAAALVQLDVGPGSVGVHGTF